MNSAPRWRIILIALVLALTIGNVGQPVFAQQTSERILNSRVSVSPTSLGRICLYDIVEVDAQVMRQVEFSDRIPEFLRPDSTITARVEDPDIVSLLGQSRTFTYFGSTFRFRGDKEGITALIFNAEVTLARGEEGIGATLVEPNKLQTIVVVEVKECKFKVKATQQAIVAGGSNFNIVAMLDDVEITGDEQGHFTATTPVNWVGAASSLGICSASINVASTTQANLTANMDESGQLTGSISIEAPETTVTATCVGISQTDTMSLSSDPLIFSVPSSGGVVKVAQGFVFETANMPGSAVIVVVPVEDEGTAFIPTEQEARVGPLFRGWATQWDGFLSLFDVLLALH